MCINMYATHYELIAAPSTVKESWAYWYSYLVLTALNLYQMVSYNTKTGVN